MKYFEGHNYLEAYWVYSELYVISEKVLLHHRKQTADLTCNLINAL